MFMIILLGALTVVASGFAARHFLLWRKSQFEIDKKELLIGCLVMSLVVIPATAFIGYKVAINNQVTYEETWSGWETQALKIVTQCYKTKGSNPCRHCYDCDPYTVKVPYDCSYTDSKGKRVSKTCDRDETRWHSCPYATEEWTFVVKSTIDDWTIADRNLPTNPENYRWSAWKGIPDSWENDPYHTGVPKRWQVVKDRLDAGRPDPVAVRKDYENYILASQNTILKQYSDSMEKYKAAGLFPKLAVNPYDIYYLDRVYFVGVRPEGDWNKAINRFNAALGTTLQGDLHLVVVDANKVTDPSNYHLALMAYWQGPDFGKQALSKNAIVVILGTRDGKTVEWAKASTGMPLGNEMMLQQMSTDLKGVALEPEAMLGYPAAKVLGERQVQVNITQSALEKIIWGPNKFQRVRMKDHGPDSPGYAYLIKEIRPTTEQLLWIHFFVFLFTAACWTLCAYIGTPGLGHRRFR